MNTGCCCPRFSVFPSAPTPTPSGPQPFTARIDSSVSSNGIINVIASGSMIDWGDGSPVETGLPGGNVHNYQNGEFQLLIYGNAYIRIWGFRFTEVISFGTYPLPQVKFADGFTKYSHNLVAVPAQLPSTITSTVGMFYKAYSFNQDISSWDMSNVTNMAVMFGYTTTFNQPLNSWDVSNVTNMTGTFTYAVAFNQPLNNWNVGSVTLMGDMFAATTSAFNQDISAWDVSQVTHMLETFRGASSMNQDLSGWCVGNVTNSIDFAQSTPSWVLPKPNFASPPC